MKTFLRRLWSEEDGQGLVEYALIASLIAIAAIVALVFLSGKVGNSMNSVGNNLN
jgi:pilus assembly protein Flp/PilA